MDGLLARLVVLSLKLVPDLILQVSSTTLSFCSYSYLMIPRRSKAVDLEQGMS